MSDIAFESQCALCNEPGRKRIILKGGAMMHYQPPSVRLVPRAIEPNDPIYVRCNNYDDECRSLGEPFGWFTFAWLPRRCRNGKRRWLVSLERHSDGTYTLGNRAH